MGDTHTYEDSMYGYGWMNGYEGGGNTYEDGWINRGGTKGMGGRIDIFVDITFCVEVRS